MDSMLDAMRGIFEVAEQMKATKHSQGSWRKRRSPGYLSIMAAIRGSRLISW